MSDELVLRDDADGVTTLTLNRPDKLNALNPSVFIALRAHIDALADDDSVRCVVLTGAGRSFCAGHDLGAIAHSVDAQTWQLQLTAGGFGSYRPASSGSILFEGGVATSERIFANGFD